MLLGFWSLYASSGGGTGVHGRAQSLPASRSFDSLEYLPRGFFNHGRRQDPARIYLHNLDSGILSLFMHPLLHRTRPRFRILDLDVCSLKGARIRRYGVHRAKETATYLPSLVPSCNRAYLLLVLLHRIHGSSKMVRIDNYFNLDYLINTLYLISGSW